MKKLTLTTLVAALTFAVPAFANDAHHPEGAPATKTVASAKNAAPVVQKMQSNVATMKVQLERIAKAKTDEERQAAMMEHMKTMQDNMHMAKGMMGGMKDCPMMGGGMGAGMMGGQGMGMMGGSAGGAGPGMAGPGDRLQNMERRMDMMQMKMDQMGRGDAAPAAPAPALPAK